MVYNIDLYIHLRISLSCFAVMLGPNFLCLLALWWVNPRAKPVLLTN